MNNLHPKKQTVEIDGRRSSSTRDTMERVLALLLGLMILHFWLYGLRHGLAAIRLIWPAVSERTWTIDAATRTEIILALLVCYFSAMLVYLLKWALDLILTERMSKYVYESDGTYRRIATRFRMYQLSPYLVNDLLEMSLHRRVVIEAKDYIFTIVNPTTNAYTPDPDEISELGEKTYFSDIMHGLALGLLPRSIKHEIRVCQRVAQKFGWFFCIERKRPKRHQKTHS